MKKYCDDYSHVCTHSKVFCSAFPITWIWCLNWLRNPPCSTLHHCHNHPPPLHPPFVLFAVCVFSRFYSDLRFLVTSVFLYRYVCCSWVGKPLCLKMTNCNKSSIPPWQRLLFVSLNSNIQISSVPVAF